MAFDPLATAADLADRNIGIPDGVNVDAVLASVSAAIRDAAGCAITQATSTVVLVVSEYCEFTLPAGPVASVASVQSGGHEVTGWVKVGDTILMPAGWTYCLPVEVTVTYTHGYPVIPADIVDLACGMASMAFEATGGSYGATGRSTYIKLGDYGEGFANPAGTESASPVAIPASVRSTLRARFGTGVAVVAVR